MTHKLDADDFFIHRVQRACAEHGWNFFLVEPTWVEAFYEKLQKGKIWARVLLNMHSEHHQPEEIFHRLVRLAFERKTQVIDPPDIARAAFDKSQLHPKLEAAGFGLPWTMIVPAAVVSSLKITAEDRARLGARFVVKPGLGYGKGGVILDAQSETDVIRSALLWPGSDYLLQERVVPRSIEGRPAYFRVFYAFGCAWFCWWNCYDDRYAVVSADEMERHNLRPLDRIVRQLAALTQMHFFSSEIAIDAEGKFILIDYVNDQCHMLTQSANPQIGVPDRVVAEIAGRLVDGAAQWIK